MIVSERGDLIYLYGRTGPFLEPSPGEPDTNVFNMAREGLRLELPAAVRQANGGGVVVRRVLQVKTNGGFSTVRLTVRRLPEPEIVGGAYLVSFELEEPEEQKSKGTNRRQDGAHVRRVTALEEELQRTKENLQGTIEELETSNEELKSTNEELQSTNEELQSANEELETSREELQSLNEELQTVNLEFEERNRELSQTNDDMQNLLNSTEIATVFLNDKLVVKRFTTQAKKVFNLIETDIGRPISDLTANLKYEALVDDAREVTRTLVFREREIETKDGSWRLMRIMPYRTHENVIDGLVITLVDIDRLKRAEQDTQDAQFLVESIVESVDEALVVLDETLNVVSANAPFHRLLRTTSKQIAGRPLSEVANGAWNVPELLTKLAEIASDDGRSIDGLRVRLRGASMEDRSVRVSARRLQARPEHPVLLLLSVQDPSPRARDTSREENRAD